MSTPSDPEPSRRRFSLEEARLLLPEVRRLTRAAVTAVDRIQEALSGSDNVTPEAVTAAEKNVREIVEGWAAGITALGAEAKGLWLVDFDNGAGYFCWQHPERELGTTTTTKRASPAARRSSERWTPDPSAPIVASMNRRASG